MTGKTARWALEGRHFLHDSLFQLPFRSSQPRAEGDQLSIFSVGFERPAPAQWTVKASIAAVPATGAAFERERDFVELDEGHDEVDSANSHTHDHLSRHVQVRHPLLRSASKAVDKPGLAWLAELPGAEIATCPALGTSHRPSSNYYGKNARQRFSANRRRKGFQIGKISRQCVFGTVA